MAVSSSGQHVWSPCRHGNGVLAARGKGQCVCCYFRGTPSICSHLPHASAGTTHQARTSRFFCLIVPKNNNHSPQCPPMSGWPGLCCPQTVLSLRLREEHALPKVPGVSACLSTAKALRQRCWARAPEMLLKTHVHPPHRHPKRQTHAKRHRHTDSHTPRQTQRHRETQTYRQRHTEARTERQRHTDVQSQLRPPTSPPPPFHNILPTRCSPLLLVLGPSFQDYLPGADSEPSSCSGYLWYTLPSVSPSATAKVLWPLKQRTRRVPGLGPEAALTTVQGTLLLDFACGLVLWVEGGLE